MIRKALSLRIFEMGIGSRRLFLSRCAAISGKKCHNRMKGRLPRNVNIDLGLAILASTSEPPHIARTIAACCGCSRQSIQQIEQKALRKLRAALYKNRMLCEAFENELQGYRRNEFRYGERSELLTTSRRRKSVRLCVRMKS